MGVQMTWERNADFLGASQSVVEDEYETFPRQG